MATGTQDVDTPSRSEENDDGGTGSEAIASDDEGASSDSEAPDEEEKEKEKTCPSLRLDQRLQRALFQFEDEYAVEEAAEDPQNLSQTLTKFMNDMCGWVPDTSVQYRRQVPEKQPSKTGGRANSKPVDTGGSASRRLAYLRNPYGQRNQQTAPNVEYEFKHYSNIKKYSEQYRRYHTCGGPLQKLTQSAFGGKTRTIYYAGDATAEAGIEVQVDVGNSSTRGSSQQQPLNRTGQGPGHGSGATVRAPRIAEKPNSNSQPIVSYSDISVNSPRYNLLMDSGFRKGRAHMSTMEWSHQLDGGGGPGYNPQTRTGAGGHAVGNQPGQWNVATNEHSLTVYTSKPPGSLQAPTRPASPPKPHLPFFPSQQPLRQLHASRTTLTPPAPNPANYSLPNGYSLERSLGTQAAGFSTGISPRNPVPHRDFYSQLMHAARCLSLAAKSPKGFDFELPRWPTCTTHPEIKPSTPPLQHTFHQAKSPKSSSSASRSQSSDAHSQITGRKGGTPPIPTHQSAASTSRPSRRHHAKAKKAPTMYSLENPAAATKETHYITIEAPTCSPFDTRSAPHAKRDPEEVGCKTSYRVTLKEKPVVADLKEKTPVEMVADANKPMAVCEVTWF